MTNLINVEKSLKHWLKNKVTVTTATVVGFLIMGTVSFGKDYTEMQNINSGKTFTLKEKETIKINSEFGTGIYAQDSFKIIVEKNSNIDVQGSTTTEGIFVNNVNAVSSIENYGNIKSTVSGGGSTSAIAVQGNVTADLNITNYAGATLETNYINGDGIGARAVVDLSPDRQKSTANVNFTNYGTIIVSKGTAVALTGKSTFKNEGTIILKDKESSAIKNNTDKVIETTGTIRVEGADKNFDVNSLFTGKTGVEHLGAIQDDKGNSLENRNSIYLSGVLNTKVINDKGNSFKSSVTLGKDKETKIDTSSSEAIKLKSLNIIGKVDLIKSTTLNNDNISIENTTVNIDKNGLLNANGVNLSITGNNVNTFENGIAVNLTNSSTLSLKDVKFNGGISSDDNENKLNISGNTYINGKIGVKNINVGTGTKAVGSDKLTLASSSSFTKDTTLTNGTTGTTVFEIGANGENALNNSTGKVTVDGNVDFDTSNLTVDTTVNLKGQADNNLTQMEYENITDGIYTTNYDEKNKTLEVKYNKTLSGNTALDSVNNILQSVNNKLNNADKAGRVNQVDEIYSGNIYSETTRAMYDNLKMNEETILSLGRTANLGEVTTHGKALFSKDKYDREGQLNSFDAKVETSGLLAGVEYGLSENTSIGTVFSGSKQDVKVNNGKSDADLFYFGVYGNKTCGNYDFTAGLGYQFGKYDSKYNIGNLYGEDKYDSQAFNGYVQGKYIANFEDGLSIQPKVKLGYTYLKQDDAKDANFGVSDAEITTYDTEVGVDVVKSVQFENSKLDVTFGTSYVRTMGDTDKEFKLSTVKGSANILGAELDENVIKFNLGAEVGNENGFFYNGGFTYEFGGNDTKAYGVNAGVGYKF